MDIKCTDYKHHSNPLSNPLSWVFFQKFFARPAVAEAQAIIKRSGSTAEEIKEAAKLCQALDQKINGSASAPMIGGKCVEQACDLHFLENRPSEMAFINHEHGMTAQTSLKRIWWQMKYSR